MRRILVAVVAVAGIASSSAACGTSYQVPNLSQAGVIENLACDNLPKAASTMQTAIQESDTETLAAIGVTDGNKESIEKALDARKQTCSNPGAPVNFKKPGEPEVEVITHDGARSRVPVVADNGQMVKGDSTKVPDTPPVGSLPILERCKGVLGWDELVTCVGDEQWYKDGVNRMKPYSGFDWNDVLKWKDAKDVNGNLVDARLIHVYSKSEADEPKQQARDDVRSLIGNAADDLGDPQYHGEFVNSRGLEHEQVSPFVDRHTQVRVSLAPLILNEQGQVTGMRDNAGIFVDCLNIWGLQFAIAPSPEKPAMCPGTNMPVPPEGPKGCNPPPTTTTPPPPPPGCVGEKCKPSPPCEGPQCHPITPKVRTDAPGQGGKGTPGPNGGDGTERHTADPTTAPPKAGPAPSTQHPSQPRPTNTGVPVSATPTSTPPPQPPESGSNPTGGGGNTGDPGDF